jgi:hypothetical protein
MAGSLATPVFAILALAACDGSGRATVEFPGLQLPVDHPWFARDGSTWLRMNRGAQAATALWVVLDPDGRPRGRLELPSDVRRDRLSSSRRPPGATA